MLELRNTPGENGQSPAETVYGFEMRSFIPSLNQYDLLTEKHRQYYDAGSHNLPPLGVDNKVRIQHEETKRWDRKGIVLRVGKHRKYLVRMENGY